MKANHQNLIHPEKEENNIRIKKIAMRYILYWACLGFVVLGGCKSCDREKVPPIEKPISASFNFYDQVGPFGSTIGDPSYRLIETDTFYLAKAGTYTSFRVIYIASDSTCDSYTWKIGDDPRTFKGKTSALLFDSPGLYAVNLKVTKTAKDGTKQKDSLTRNFRIIQTEYFPIIGKYIGYNISKPDSLFKFFIGHGSQNRMVWGVDTLKNSSGITGYAMIGLQGAKLSSHGLAISSKGAYTDDTWDPWPEFTGNFIFKDLFITTNRSYDSVIIDYWKYMVPIEFPTTSGGYVKEKFIGKRYL